MAIRLNLSRDSHLMIFLGQFLRKIGWFNVFEVAVSPEQRRRGEESPGFDRHIDIIHLVYATFLDHSIGWVTCHIPTFTKVAGYKH
jgi:hypothetical protein